jgi:hypothetical protein
VEIEIFIDSVLRDGVPLARFEQVRRDGRQVAARVQSQVSIQSAALNCTTDNGPWQKRAWQVLPAIVDSDGRSISAELPAQDGITWFLTVTDERGATVSSEHESIAPREATTSPAAS